MSQAPVPAHRYGPDLVTVTRDRLAVVPPDPGRLAPLAGVRADVVLDAGEAGSCTIVLWDGRVSAHPGRTASPVTRIAGDLETLVAVVEGRLSGVEAFLDDRILVSGNLALSLQLEGLFEAPDHHLGRSIRAGVVDVGRVRTAYLEAGPPDGRPVVLLHGLGATNASMLPTMWDLASDYRVIAPDLPGHGASSAPGLRYDARFFGEWLTGLLDELGVADAVLTGNSLGGRISLEIALAHPDRVQALILLAPAVAFRRLRQFVPFVRVLRPELASLPLPMTQGVAERGLRAMFAHPERLSPSAYHAAAGEFVRVYHDRAHRVAFYSALRQIYLDDAFGDEGFWARLPGLEPPALFVWGTRDRLVPAAFSRHVDAALPTATTVVLDDCGHVPQFELPGRTNELIRAFLTTGAGGSGPVRRARPGSASR
jgi:pimeloyl-ACP methyl ester carboxylesterase